MSKRQVDEVEEHINTNFHGTLGAFNQRVRQTLYVKPCTLKETLVLCTCNSAPIN